MGTRIKLCADDKLFLEGNHRLNDKHINFAQAILRVQFPQYDGFQNTLLQDRCKYTITSQMVQILHICHDHWVVISNLQSKENELKLMIQYMMILTKASLYKMFDEEITITMDIQWQKQERGKDCGMFCIAITTSLLHGLIPGEYVQSHLRSHLVFCIGNGIMEPFP